MAKILLVEDDNNLREIFEMRLQAEGYQTLTASNGEEALVVAMKEKPDLIVADVMMPKLSGFEMLETLRAAPEMRDTKVIMMTALGQAEDQARGEKLGVVKYLVKSQVTLEDFARVIHEVLQPEAGKADKLVANNKEESEQAMPDDTSTNPSAPTPPVGGDGASSNPISSTPAGDDTTATNQQSTAEEQSGVQNQIDSFASSSPSAPAGGPDAPAPDSGAAPASDIPVSQPPVDGDGPTAPAGDSSTPSAPSGL